MLVSLARLACDLRNGPSARVAAEALRFIDLSDALAADEPDDLRFGPSVAALVAAMTIARTPAAPL